MAIHHRRASGRCRHRGGYQGPVPADDAIRCQPGKPGSSTGSERHLRTYTAAKFRFTYSRTVSRPDFRELSPFEFTNVQGGFNVAGNPDLRRAKIDNFDGRWEWFPGGSQLIAASFFSKKFSDPIETTVQATADLRSSFLNAKSAVNRGFELEARRGLGFLAKRLTDMGVQANFTFVDSNVTIRPEDQGILTSLSRPLAGQSRFIYNVIASWNRPAMRSQANFYVNGISRRLSAVGAIGLPDIYQEGNLFLDFVYQYSITETGKAILRFSAENLGTNGPLDAGEPARPALPAWPHLFRGHDLFTVLRFESKRRKATMLRRIVAAFAVTSVALLAGSIGGFSTVDRSTAERLAASISGPPALAVEHSNATLYIWTDKYVYQPGEPLTLRMTARTNDPYPYTILVFRQNNQTGKRTYYTGNRASDAAVDIYGNPFEQGFQPSRVADQTRSVVIGDGGWLLNTPLTVPSSWGCTR